MKLESLSMFAASGLLLAGAVVFDCAVPALRVAAVTCAVGAGALAAFMWSR